MEKAIELADNNGSFNTRLFFWAGVSAVAIGVGYILITIGFVVSVPPLPNSAAAWVTYLNGKSFIWWSIVWCSIITDILYLPVAYGLFELFRKTHKGMMLISLTIFGLFVVLELSITWSRYPTLLDLVSRYHGTTDTELRMIYLAAIEAISTEFRTPVTAFYTIFFPSIAVIIASLVMIKTGKFGRIIPLFGLISGVCNSVSVFGGYIYEPVGKLVIPGSILVLFWFLGMGITLIGKKKSFSSRPPS